MSSSYLTEFLSKLKLKDGPGEVAHHTVVLNNVEM